MIPQRKSTHVGADSEVLGKISQNMDMVVSLSATDVELRTHVLKFQLEQAADQAAFEAAGKDGNRQEHLRKVLQRMADLALAVAQQVLRRTAIDFQQRSETGGGERSGPTPPTPTSPEMFQASSVADFAEGTETWLETGATLSAKAVEILAMTLIAHTALRPALQEHMLENQLVAYLAEALAVPREHEITYFGEGYKTEHMRLISNFAFENAAAAKAIVQNERLLREVLSGTKIDEENPGMVEWAEFAIRNLCETSQEARTKLKQLTPVALSKETKDILEGKVDYTITEDGKVKLKPTTQPTPSDSKLQPSSAQGGSPTS